MWKFENFCESLFPLIPLYFPRLPTSLNNLCKGHKDTGGGGYMRYTTSIWAFELCELRTAKHVLHHMTNSSANVENRKQIDLIIHFEALQASNGLPPTPP